MMSMAVIAPLEKDEFLTMATRHFSELNPAFVPHDDWATRYFPSILATPDCFLRWILCGDTKAGFILFGLENHRFLPRRTGVIYELYILPQFRRRGLAKACALEVIKELQAYRPSKLQLEVVDGHTAAIAFWKSLGFRKVAERLVLDGRAL